jgi:hypothetical protein
MVDAFRGPADNLLEVSHDQGDPVTSLRDVTYCKTSRFVFDLGVF